MDKINLLDLRKQYKNSKKEIDKALKGVIDAQSLVLGKYVDDFEKEVASFCGTKYAVGLNSGTDALILGLDALGIKTGDEVITTPFTFIATAEAIVRVGAKPVFVDIEPKTYNINPALIEKSITKRTKAIIPVHLYGLPSDMKAIRKTAKKYRLKVLEDCAQAIGSTYYGKKTGNMSEAGCFSFFPSKNLGGFGDGGMLVTNSKALNEKVRCLRNHGSRVRYYHDLIGYNSRLDAVQAAVLRVKLKKIDKWNADRIKNAAFYDKELSDCPVTLPFVPKGYKHTYHLYMLRTKKQKALIEYLIGKNIDSRAYYPIPLHLQKCFSYLGYKKGDFPEAEKASKEVLNLPVYPELSLKQKRYITGAIKDFFNKKK